MGLKHVEFRFTGGDRGWIGDVPRFRYDLSKIHQLGWKAKRSSDEAVRLAVHAELDRKGWRK
jgi:UDP-glucose 4-epimerase